MGRRAPRTRHFLFAKPFLLGRALPAKRGPLGVFLILIRLFDDHLAEVVEDVEVDEVDDEGQKDTEEDA